MIATNSNRSADLHRSGRHDARTPCPPSVAGRQAAERTEGSTRVAGIPDGAYDLAYTAGRDWDPGLPLDLDRIREKDEAYWEEHRGAPKAFLSIDGGRELWSTRWGRETALRLPAGIGGEEELRAAVLQARREKLEPWRASAPKFGPRTF